MNNTLVKGLNILQLLAHADGMLGVSDIARALSMGKSNVHSLLGALVELGYASRDEERGTYGPTLRIWELGCAVLGRLDVRRAAEEPMYELLERTRETVHLSVLEGDDVVYVHKLDSPEPVRSYTVIGGRAPAYCVATGKAMLAFQPPAHIESLGRRLVRHSENTIVDPRVLDTQLRKVRTQGYAENRGEWRASVWGLAAPVYGTHHEVIAAIGISGPAERIRKLKIREIAPCVIEAATQVSMALGPPQRTGRQEPFTGTGPAAGVKPGPAR